MWAVLQKINRRGNHETEDLGNVAIEEMTDEMLHIQTVFQDSHDIGYAQRCICLWLEAHVICRIMHWENMTMISSRKVLRYAGRET